MRIFMKDKERVSLSTAEKRSVPLRILVVADEPVKRLWSEYGRDTLKEADIILSCGDLPSSYLSYLTCFTHAPVIYVHGNHDHRYAQQPPEGCVNADGRIVIAHGLRILGLGGSIRYHPDAPCMYSETEMRERISSLRRELRRTGGFDILLTHAPIAGLGDQADAPHRGFECFRTLLDKYRPAVMFHGHVHQAYSGSGFVRIRDCGGVPVINACGSYVYSFPTDYIPLEPPTASVLRRLEKISVP